MLLMTAAVLETGQAKLGHLIEIGVSDTPTHTATTLQNSTHLNLAPGAKTALVMEIDPRVICGRLLVVILAGFTRR